MQNLKLETNADGFALLTLDAAGQSMNVVNDAFLADMEAVTAQIAADDSIKGVILTSGKPAFMAGADLTQLVQSFGKLTPKEAFGFSQRATAMHRGIEKSGKPWVAAINGLALGGGFELALACHHRVLVDNPKALVGLPEVNVGLLPGSGGTVRLGILIGFKKALDLLLTGRTVAPAEALKLGIVDEVVPAEKLIDASRAWLAAGPDPVRPWDVKGWVPPQKKGLTVPEDSAAYMMMTGAIAQKGYNTPAPQAILSCVFEGLQLPFDKALAVESKYFAKLLTDPVARNIIRTTFISKLAAEKGARRPAGVPKSEVRKLGVLGAGMMGAGIAFVSATAGIEVVLLDRDVPTAEKGKAYTAKVQGKLIEKGKLSQDKADAVLARITPTDDYALLEGCDMIVEAVFEDMGIKAETTRKAEAVIPASAVYASNTSSLPISELAKASQRPDQFIGIHFFSPVDRMGLVEVIVGKQTSKETLARALDFIAQLRKTPIVVNDSRGFYTSRVFRMFIFEGVAMLEDGVEPARIENAAKAAGFPIGPLALLDEVTMELPVKIIDEAARDAAMTVNKYTIERGMPVLQRMIALGRGSRKAGGGFYEYPATGGKRLWPGLAQEFPPAAEQPDLEELKKRFLYSQANETAQTLEEGVLETPEDADLGAIYGWGFPAWTGGTLSYIDTVGIATFVAEADRLAKLYGSRFAPSAWLRAKAEKGEGFYPAATAAAAPAAKELA
ncbi:3-hydroxyacyl-CoA dehydrogenase/enoyl-CoA hydratase/3-hydroxybutyryl-CoA epimerase [Sphingobium fontiphilum]|uniref:3-hydroxyacyl-CoA dehydrogenase/enoyl-CoA hydratase/3-hydroxybutyryl-CoA epimerase n=1 Tax=Sphingobium fontiphilum TaxID=944425 RepID=A0A7W6DMU2_9SPHN|nr:3-hydroxyacyl-CoA dehydrogenase NAD-binding domain-containing protein [Sphingobium fontiphilum]MBB3982738.1 3-hydroxyacyl-CoA dehydrogenase/enoyl-CoA hydratase/3-hydroxybutyryl-CoA epimerase [Sphingobium fontiphilum]